MSADNPNKSIYDVEYAEHFTRAHYARQIKILSEMAAYCSNLLMRCYHDRETKFEDVIILGCLLRQFLVHFDAVVLLLEKGAGDAVQIHLRAMLEESLYFHWLVKADTANRAKHLYVWNLRKRRRFHASLAPGAPEANALLQAVGPSFADIVAKQQTPEQQAEINKQNMELDRLLSSPQYAAINQAFEGLKKLTHDVDWYRPCGPKNLREIARDVGMMAQYRFFYSKWSEAMHSSGAFDHIYVDEHGASVEPVRDLAAIASSINTTWAFAYAVFHLVLKRYRPGELPRLAEKYVNEWREGLWTTKKATANRQTEIR